MPFGIRGCCTKTYKLYLDAPPRQEDFLRHREFDKGHGRVEQLSAAIRHDAGWLRERHDWPGLRAIGKAVAERVLPDGSGSADTRYYLLGAKMTAERFAHVARSRWVIGNSLHWVLDVTMGEDAARNRRGSGAACLAVIRRLALDIARAHPANISMRRKFRRAGISFDFPLGMLRVVRRRE